jgi:hypothetical protein
MKHRVCQEIRTPKEIINPNQWFERIAGAIMGKRERRPMLIFSCSCYLAATGVASRTKPRRDRQTSMLGAG